MHGDGGHDVQLRLIQIVPLAVPEPRFAFPALEVNADFSLGKSFHPRFYFDLGREGRRRESKKQDQ